MLATEKNKEKAPMSNRLVSVCIASIGRSSLHDTIAGVLAGTLPPGFTREIVVADDSANGEATRVLAGLSASPSIRIVSSAARNIANARNCAMAQAAGEYLAFIDDDEIPATDWLEQLLRLADEYGADGVQGCVVGIYPAQGPAWARQLRPYDKRFGASGQPQQVGSTCNLLLRRAALTQRHLEFNPELGRTGGEDTDLCFRLTAAGGRIVSSANATVYEHVPVERLARKHLIRRYARGGYSYASTVLAHQRPVRRVLEIVKAVALAAGYSLGAVAAWGPKPATAMRCTLRLSGNVGKLLFFMGRRAWNLY